jgi:hypothetical protein
MPGPHGGNLTVLGLCAYCDAPTSESCSLCGRAICPDHAADDEPLCVDCAGGARSDD